jgi:hypothetical protein
MKSPHSRYSRSLLVAWAFFTRTCRFVVHWRSGGDFDANSRCGDDLLAVHVQVEKRPLEGRQKRRRRGRSFLLDGTLGRMYMGGGVVGTCWLASTTASSSTRGPRSSTTAVKYVNLSIQGGPCICRPMARRRGGDVLLVLLFPPIHPLPPIRTFLHFPIFKPPSPSPISAFGQPPKYRGTTCGSNFWRGFFAFAHQHSALRTPHRQAVHPP